MIPIILSWLYLCCILFATGLPLASAKDHVAVVIIKGMVVCTALACLMSLFMPLSIVAGIITLALAIVSVIFFRKRAQLLIAKCRDDLRNTPWLLMLLFVGYVIITAFLSSNQPSHYDEGLYYGTTIRWLEEVGIVKGLANINPRIAFNSSWMVLQALFSFHYIGNFNDLNGLLVLLVMMYSLGGLTRMLRRDYNLSVIVRSLLFLPVMTFHFGASHDFALFNINFLSSPTADLPVSLLLWLVFTWLIELGEVSAEQRQRNMVLIFAVGAMLFTIKPSAAPVLLLCVYFFAGYLLQKRFRTALGITLLASAIVVPWIIRNIFISGYVLFPFSSLDVLNVDWKLPVQHVRWFENAVRVYAISPEYDLNKPFTVPMQAWFGGWFSRLTFIQSLLFITGIFSAFSFFVAFVAGVFRNGKQYVRQHQYLMLCTVTAFAGSLFWFLKGPDFRLGYGFVAMLTVLSLSSFLRFFLREEVKYAAIVLTVAFYWAFYAHYKSRWTEIGPRMAEPLPARNQPSSIKTITLGNGIQLHLVNYGDSWYGHLPVSNELEYYTIFPVPRGDKLKDGFKASEK